MRRMAAAKTTAQRQREFRERKALQSALEVRGIFAHPDDHPPIKAYAAKLQRRREKGGGTPPASG